MDPQDEPTRHLSPEEEELLEALLTGARLAEEPEIAQRFAANPALVQEYERLQEAQHLLGSLEAPLPSEEELRREAGTQDKSQVEAILGGKGLLPGRATQGPLRWVALAATLLVLGALATLLLRERSTPGDGGRLVLSVSAEPQGPVEDFAEFRAPLELQPGERLVIRVYADAPGADRQLASDPLEASVWVPSAAQHAELLEWKNIRWTYEVLSDAAPPAPVTVFARLR